MKIKHNITEYDLDRAKLSTSVIVIGTKYGYLAFVRRAGFGDHHLYVYDKDKEELLLQELQILENQGEGYTCSSNMASLSGKTSPLGPDARICMFITRTLLRHHKAVPPANKYSAVRKMLRPYLSSFFKGRSSYRLFETSLVRQFVVELIHSKYFEDSFNFWAYEER
jgi:hypothetical protein